VKRNVDHHCREIRVRSKADAGTVVECTLEAPAA
jgi:hypothetical protein